jgi:hypothetical protein
LTQLPRHLPKWFGEGTQDDLARASTKGSAQGWTVCSLIDTGVLAGATAEMEVWWWMHGMGDNPGNGYVNWSPPTHHAIRWLPGYAPADIPVPEDMLAGDVLPGVISADLQGANLVHTGGGMMYYPREMAPVPGVYDFICPMSVVSKAQLDAWESGHGPRFPQPKRWLLHQCQDVPGGLIHRSTVLLPLPLDAPITQERFYCEHQMQEGLFNGLGWLSTLYQNWLRSQKEAPPRSASRAVGASQARTGMRAKGTDRIAH